ncbi:MAG: hypothetical protein ACP5OR_07645 [Candidatus Dormibacteria bacterium]
MIRQHAYVADCQVHISRPYHQLVDALERLARPYDHASKTVRHLLYLILLISTLASCTKVVPPVASPVSSPTSATSHLWWLVGSSTIVNLDRIGGASIVNSFFNPQHTFVVRAKKVPLQLHALDTASFTNAQQLIAAIGTFPPSTKAVLFDDEAWPLTPEVEQQSPATYEHLACQAAHAHHLLFIATPAVDLTSVLSHPHGETRVQAYLSLGIARDAAQCADIIDIQAQGLEQNLPAYVSFVRAAAAQARSVNPNVIVLAGISTNHSGNRASAPQLVAAVNATKSIVNGYWLNDPAGGPSCPRCTGPYPQVTLTFLKDLQHA